MATITPCLLLDNTVEQAMQFYTDIFKNSVILEVMRHGTAGPGPEGSVLSATFVLEGQKIVAINAAGCPPPGPAISLFITCQTQQEIDYYWQKLVDGGNPMQCGWLTDKFGICWQVVPEKLGELLQGEDAARSNRVMVAMMQMVKLDLGLLQKAHDGI